MINNAACPCDGVEGGWREGGGKEVDGWMEDVRQAGGLETRLGQIVKREGGGGRSDVMCNIIHAAV